MKKKLHKTALALFSAVTVLAVFTAQADEALKKESQQALSAFKAKDPSLAKFMQKSAGYVIFPSVGKGGFIVGGAHGKGLVVEKNKITGEATLTQASIGAQAGGQSFSELIVFETAEALRNFKGNNFEMSADISAVAAAEGASQAARYREGVAVFTLPKKGLMVEAAVGGQKFKFEPLE